VQSRRYRCRYDNAERRMTAATTVRRALRPRHVHFAANYLWIVDETQPVAALLEPDTYEVQKIVEWSALPARPPGTRAGEIVSDDHGLWVQSHSEGPLVRVTPNGIEHAEYTEHHVLLCAGPTGAWAVSLPHKRNDVARTRDTRPQRNPVPRPELLLAPPGGGVRLFRVEDVLAAVDFDEAADTRRRARTLDASATHLGSRQDRPRRVRPAIQQVVVASALRSAHSRRDHPSEVSILTARARRRNKLANK